MKHRTLSVAFILSFIVPSLSYAKSGGWRETGGQGTFAQRRGTRTNAGRNQAPYQAKVHRDEAVFTFPLSPEREYRWSNGGLTYEWSVTVNSNGRAYEFGFYLVTAMGASMEESGDIRALLQAGECSISKLEGGRYSELDVEAATAEIKCSASNDRTSLSVKLIGEDLIRHFFSSKPGFVSFRTGIGPDSRPSMARVPVRYSSASSTTRSSLNNSVPCLTSTEARDLLLPLAPLHQPGVYQLYPDTVVYNRLSLSDVQSNYPIIYLFFRRGFINLEDNGATTFESLTGRGQQLRARYPRGIPFDNLSLASVRKVICKGTDAKVQVTVSARPTQIAINLLGPAIFSTRPFSKPNGRVVSFVYRSGSLAHLQATQFLPGTGKE